MQGEFTKEEADATIEAVKEVWDMLSKPKQRESFGHMNDIFLFLEAAKRAAPSEADAKLAKELSASAAELSA